MTWRERERTRSPTNGKKRSSAKNPAAAPSFLYWNMKSQFLLLLQRLLHTGCPPAGLPSRVIAVAPEFGQNQEKTRRPSPHAADSSDDDPLSDQDPGTKSKGRKQDYTSPAEVVVVDEDDDKPLPSRSCKTLAKKPKIQPPMPAQQDVLNQLTL